jgi:predicted dehydrogenase
MTRPRIGLVGFGRWGRNILRDLRALGCPVSVVVRGDPSPAKEAGASSTVSSIEQLRGVDGVVVSTPTSTHAEVTERVLDHLDGPVFVEKPLTDDPASARRLAERAPDRLFVMDKWRYHPGVEALRDLAKDGGVGRVRGLRTVRHQWGVHHRDVDGIWILAPHEIAIVREILGSLPPPVAALGYSVGPDATLSAVFGSDPWVSLEVSTVSNGYRREIALLGEQAVGILPDPYADHIEVRRLASDEVRRIAISTELPLLRELRAFVEHVEGGPPPRSNAAEGAEAVATIAELRRLAGLEGS